MTKTRPRRLLAGWTLTAMSEPRFAGVFPRLTLLRLSKAGEFDEAEHPRAEDGKFSENSGAGLDRTRSQEDGKRDEIQDPTRADIHGGSGAERLEQRDVSGPPRETRAGEVYYKVVGGADGKTEEWIAESRRGNTRFSMRFIGPLDKWGWVTEPVSGITYDGKKARKATEQELQNRRDTMSTPQGMMPLPR